jgi:pantothenate kinase-related protein Tda10
MDFNLETDLDIFNHFFEKRPEVTSDSLKIDLEKYYLPYIKKLIDLKQQKSPNEGLIVGVSAIQGAGKTTQGEILEILLKHFGHSTISRSIDDHYITHKELCELRSNDPRFIRRGITHDIQLAIQNLKSLQQMDDVPLLVSGYFKGANHGDGERFRWINLIPDLQVKAKIVEEELMVDKSLQRLKSISLISATFEGKEVSLPENMGSNIAIVEHLLPPKLLEFLNSEEVGQEITIFKKGEDNAYFFGRQEVSVLNKELPSGWELVTKKPDFIFYDGWMLGARSVEDESVFESNLPALDTPEHIQFAKDVNKKLSDYETLWGMFGFINVLLVLNYEMSLKWRDQAEDALRSKGQGMSPDEIREFVYYFWRSVHPGIHIKNLAKDALHTNQVVIINDDHSVGDILSPTQVT